VLALWAPWVTGRDPDGTGVEVPEYSWAAADGAEPLQASGRRRMALLWMWLRCFRREANSGPNDVKERPLPVICSAFTFLKENRC